VLGVSVKKNSSEYVNANTVQTLTIILSQVLITYKRR